MAKKSKKPTKAQIKKVLTCTLDLFKDKTKWTTDAWARDEAGCSIGNPKDPEAVCWCLDGGLMKCSPDFSGDINASSPIYDAAVDTLVPLAVKQAGTTGLYCLNDGVVEKNGGLSGVRKLLRAGIKALS